MQNFIQQSCVLHEYSEYIFFLILLNYIFSIQKHTVLIYKMTSKWMMIVFACSPVQILNVVKNNSLLLKYRRKKRNKNARSLIITGDRLCKCEGTHREVTPGAGLWISSGSCTVPLRTRSAESALGSSLFCQRFQQMDSSPRYFTLL